tara:strand:- start:6148 stop:6672 length:525 start_codon:yes stop_codon:yes gene_type:complete
MSLEELKKSIIAESNRIEEDAEHSFKGHFNSAEFWSHINLALGLPAALLGAFAGGTSAADGSQAAITGTALLASALVTCMTFLKPSEKSDSHKNAGSFYQALRNQTRLFREIDLEFEGDEKSIRKRLLELSSRRDELNSTMPSIPRAAYEKAKKDIDSGRARYQVDKERLNDER